MNSWKPGMYRRRARRRRSSCRPRRCRATSPAMGCMDERSARRPDGRHQPQREARSGIMRKRKKMKNRTMPTQCGAPREKRAAPEERPAAHANERPPHPVREPSEREHDEKRDDHRRRQSMAAARRGALPDALRRRSYRHSRRSSRVIGCACGLSHGHPCLSHGQPSSQGHWCVAGPSAGAAASAVSWRRGREDEHQAQVSQDAPAPGRECEHGEQNSHDVHPC